MGLINGDTRIIDYGSYEIVSKLVVHAFSGVPIMRNIV